MPAAPEPGGLCQSLRLHHVDRDLLVIDKPAGLLAVPGKGPDKQDCLSARVQQRYPDARVVHRLDMATSGLMLMARTAAAQRLLSQAFALRQVQTRYVAVVCGHLTTPLDAANGWSLIDRPIAVDWPRRPVRVIDTLHGKPSQTRWKIDNGHGPVSTAEQGTSTRLLLEPLTGRSHQLRVHLQALGHPILGDALYADAAVAAGSDRLLLHASALGFTHPVTGHWLAFESPAPF